MSKRVPVIGRLRGDEISFTVGTDRYTGRVNGDALEGQVLSAWKHRDMERNTKVICSGCTD